jgi:hypothetical protein
MAIIPKAIYMFNTIPMKILMAFIKKIGKSTLNFIWRHKRSRIAKAMLNKKSSAGSIIICVQTMLESHGNKNSMILAQKQI